MSGKPLDTEGTLPRVQCEQQITTLADELSSDSNSMAQRPQHTSPPHRGDAIALTRSWFTGSYDQHLGH